MVHSGGFYRVEKRRIGPGEMPAVCTVQVGGGVDVGERSDPTRVVYYLTGGALLVDPRIAAQCCWPPRSR